MFKFTVVVAVFQALGLKPPFPPGYCHYKNKLECCDPLDLNTEKEIYRNMSCSWEFPIN